MLRFYFILFFMLLHFIALAQQIVPQRLNDNINTFSHEYWPSITASDSILIFNRLITRNGYKNEDIYYSKKDSLGNWTKSLPFKTLNTEENEGAQTISADGRFMIFTSCNNRNSYGSCDLFYSIKIGEEWIPAQNLGSDINTKYWETQPALSADGTELYFVSNRPEGNGGMDIWHSKLRYVDDSGRMHWSTPKNLNINTPDNEMSPFIHIDNETLYFSSNGYGEEDQLDIFMATKKDNLFSVPRNIGAPINTKSDEIGFVVNAAGTTAYFSSDKEGHNRDIYSILLPETFRPRKVKIVQGRVLDAKSKKPIFAMIRATNTKDTTVYNTMSDMTNGNYLVCLTEGKDWQISVQAETYLFYSKILPDSLKSQHKNIFLKPIEKNARLTLHNIFFDTDKSILKEASKIELANVKQLLLQNPSLHIELNGHTDNQGAVEYNQKLSEDRARAVLVWLINNGIAPNRLTAKGYGELQPVATNETAEGRAQNRRTELKVVEY